MEGKRNADCYDIVRGFALLGAGFFATLALREATVSFDVALPGALAIWLLTALGAYEVFLSIQFIEALVKLAQLIRNTIGGGL